MRADIKQRRIQEYKAKVLELAKQKAELKTRYIQKLKAKPIPKGMAKTERLIREPLYLGSGEGYLRQDVPDVANRNNQYLRNSNLRGLNFDKVVARFKPNKQMPYLHLCSL